MKKLMLASLVCLLLAPLASADLMMTAAPLGKGKLNLMTEAVADFNFAGMGSNAYAMNDRLGCGLNDRLDLYAGLGVGYSARTGLMDPMTITSYSLDLKYAVWTESPTQPYSLAVDLGLGSMPMSSSGMNQMQGSLALIVSKMAAGNFNPYGGVAYRVTRQGSGDFSQIDYTLGAGFGPADKMLMVEYTLQLMSVAGGTNASTLANGNHYYSSQVAVGGSLALN